MYQSGAPAEGAYHHQESFVTRAMSSATQYPNTFETIFLFNNIIKGRYINVALLSVSFTLHLFLQMYSHFLSWLIIVATVSSAAVKAAWIEKYKPDLYQFQIAPLKTSLIHDCSKVYPFSSSLITSVSDITTITTTTRRFQLYLGYL